MPHKLKKQPLPSPPPPPPPPHSFTTEMPVIDACPCPKQRSCGRTGKCIK